MKSVNDQNPASLVKSSLKAERQSLVLFSLQIHFNPPLLSRSCQQRCKSVAGVVAMFVLWTSVPWESA